VVSVFFLRQPPPPPNHCRATISSHRITSSAPLLHRNGTAVPIPSPSLLFTLAFNSCNRRTYGHQDPPLLATIGLHRLHDSPAFNPIKRMPWPCLISFAHGFLWSVPQPSCPWAPPAAASVHHHSVEIHCLITCIHWWWAQLDLHSLSRPSRQAFAPGCGHTRSLQPAPRPCSAKVHHGPALCLGSWAVDPVHDLFYSKTIREILDKSMHLANGPLVLQNFHSSPHIHSILRISGAILHFGPV
jgi:hypothetical protein